MLKKFLLILIFIYCLYPLLAQTKNKPEYWIGTVQNGDTIVQRQLKEIWVSPRRNFKNLRHEKKFWRYVYKVKKVYPYAKRANELIKKYEPEYLALDKHRDKRRLIKKVEKELMGQYENELKKLTISEGKILIKLIDRETSKTSYTLIKEFKGGFSAFFWQSIARLFGNSLKSEYDPLGEDRPIEEIVKMIELGYI